VTDDIMVMYAGQIVEKGTAKQAVFDPLHPYARGLMGSIIVPESGLRDAKLTAIPGVPPNLKNPPSGCRFAERCKYVRPECKALPVDLREIGGRRAYRCILSERELRDAYQKEADQNA
jgi:peptide/nickel transport system ATP-binding protein